MARHSIWGAIPLTLFITAGAPARLPPSFTDLVSHGPSTVGFHREWVVDSSRQWPESDHETQRLGRTGRPIRMDVWYPTAGGASCDTVPIRDYLHAVAPDPWFAATNRWVERWDSASYVGFASQLHISFDSLTELRSQSCASAPVSAGLHPLIVYSGGWYNRSPDNVGLAEYFASRGYVVAEVPLLGEGLWTGNTGYTPLALETQVRDVELTLRTLAAHPWVDRTRVLAMGYSGGGIVALLAALRDSTIAGAIGLDPSYMGEADRIFGTAYFDVDRMRVPLLTLRSGNALFTGRERNAVIDSLKRSDRYTADVGNGSHGDFGDDVLIEATLSIVRPAEPRPTSDGPG